MGNVLVQRQALVLLASLATEEGDCHQAVVYLKRMIRDSKTSVSPGLYVRLGHCYLKLNNHSAAKKGFLKGLKLTDDRNQLFQSLIWRFRQTGTLDLYMKLCQEVSRYDVKVRLALPLLLGKAMFLQYDRERAKQYLEQSMVQEETAEAHRYLALISLEQKD